MKIVFYSTNSNVFNSDKFHIDTLPSVNSIFKKFALEHENDSFAVVTQKPCFFLPSSGDVYVLPQESTVSDVASKIVSLNPDVAIAMTFWVDPFDWLTVNDSLVAEQLKAAGIDTVAHSIETGMTCFDKVKTHEKLKALGFPVPNAVFVDHDMYFCAGSNKKVIHNVYKECIASQIKKLKLPLIIKETMGVSSYGTTVVHTYGEAICYLNSKRNNSHRIVEEYISGRQFGCEIYGIPGNYTILPPVEFSLNQYGITSPKLSVKYGPLEEPQAYGADGSDRCSALNLISLYKMLETLAEDMKFRGVAQVDLVYDCVGGENCDGPAVGHGQWHIIEINPRLSGMSYTYSSMTGKSLFDLVYDTCIAGKKLTTQSATDGLKKVVNIKLPVIPFEKCKTLSKLRGVSFVHLTNNEEAKQEREKGYTEIIITGNSLFEIKEYLAGLEKALPEQCYAEDFASVESFLHSYSLS